MNGLTDMLEALDQTFNALRSHASIDSVWLETCRNALTQRVYNLEQQARAKGAAGSGRDNPQ